ncbi:MAG: hypothetical protein ACREOO_22650 [bacterium]
MALITMAIALPFAYTANRSAEINRYLAETSGLLSLAFGRYLVYRIGFVDGLFTKQKIISTACIFTKRLLHSNYHLSFIVCLLHMHSCGITTESDFSPKIAPA